MKKFLTQTALSLKALIVFLFLQQAANAQIASNAVNADPSAKAVSQVPLGANIFQTAVLKFRFSNESTATNGTGQIPANSVRLTISFPGQFAYTSVNSIPKFVVEDFDNNPFGVIHLINNALIDEGEVVDLLLNVRGVQAGSGSVTFNSDRTTPVIVANTQTSNDNSSATYLVTGTLPVTLESFGAQGQNCTAKLNWATTAELNINHYDVELSTEANETFTKVGSLNAQSAQGGRNTYSFSYMMESGKTHIFRLKIVAKDGSIKYSYVARINGGCSQTDNATLLYPSPTKSRFTLNVTDPSLTNTMAIIYDASGKRITGFIITSANVHVNVERLIPGVYIVKLATGSNVKFIKE